MSEETRIVYDDWEDELLEASKDAIECVIISAYFNDYGAKLLSKISKNIRMKTDNIPIKLLISNDFVPSRKDKIRILEKLITIEGVSVRIHNGKRFLHAKSYIFKRSDGIKVMIGSNNLTFAGLSNRNIETAILTKLDEKNPESKKLIENFNKYWKSAKKIDLSEKEVEMLKDTPKFQNGDNVINKNSNKVVTVNNVIIGAREIQYRVTFDGKMVTVPERDLDPYVDIEEKIERDLFNDNFGNYKDFKLFHTWLRLSLPLENNLYSYLGSRTAFNPYQFKPLLRFLSAGSDERLFIADEVGVGKTIETGIIMNELLSRNRLDMLSTIIVVCPNSITQKWKREMKNRFNMDFFVHENGKTLWDMLRAIQADGNVPDAYRLSIVGLQLFRSDKYLSFLGELAEESPAPIFGLVVIDEAHHLRNVGTNSYNLGMTLSGTTEMILMLSATPLNLDNSDLYNQLHILNPSIFQDLDTFQNLQNPLKNINRIIRSIYNFPQSKKEILSAIMAMDEDQIGSVLLNREWITDFRKRIEVDRKFDTQEAVKYERLFSNLNPLYSSFTRTRKREAIEHQVKREAKELPINLTPEELSFQDQVLKVIEEYFVEKGYEKSVLRLIMNTHRRMISSSIPSMMEYLKWSLKSNKIETGASAEEEDLTEDDHDFRTVEIDSELKMKFRSLLEVAKLLHDTDSKYNQFKKLLDGILDGKSVKQVIVFSFFIKTLEYLKGRLNADGYTVGMIHGNIPMITKGEMEGREEIMEGFKNGKFQILLSSEVGGEGLDFQYCNMIINYDLPYNPMRIEQRIGRIDRFGQKSDKIIVVNLFIADTVDEEIYDRLYKRIRLVEDGVGALEPIMGKEISEFQQALLSGSLSKEEMDDYQERIQYAVEHNKAEMQAFEDHRRELLNDDFLSMPINELGGNNFVKPDDLIELTKLFLEDDPHSSITINAENIGILNLSKEVKAELEVFLRTKDGRRGHIELKPLLRSSRPISVVFDGSVAENNNNYLFLPPTGFWSKFITEMLKEKKNLKRVFKFSPICDGEIVSMSKSMISIYKVEFEGLRNQIQLIGIPISLDTKEVLKNVGYEDVPRKLSNCEASESDTYFDTSLYLILKERSMNQLTDFLETKKEFMSEENTSLLNARITALEKSSQQRIKKSEKEIENHVKNRNSEGKEPDKTYERLTNAKIEKDRRLTREQIQDLKKHQNLSYSYALEALILIS